MLHSYKFLNFVFVNNNNKRHYRQCCFLLHACLDCLATTGVVSLCFYATLCLSATTPLWYAYTKALLNIDWPFVKNGKKANKASYFMTMHFPVLCQWTFHCLISCCVLMTSHQNESGLLLPNKLCSVAHNKKTPFLRHHIEQLSLLCIYANVNCGN